MLYSRIGRRLRTVSYLRKQLVHHQHALRHWIYIFIHFEKLYIYVSMDTCLYNHVAVSTSVFSSVSVRFVKLIWL